VRGDHVDVWEGTYQGSRVAIRYYNISAEDELEDVKKRFYGEVVVWKRLIHRNIVPFLGVAASSDPIPLCMVSPWMENGELRKYLGETPEADRRMLLMDVVGGIEYLHSLDIIHGNLKADNILIDSSGRARISGFGRACAATDVEAIKDWTTLLATWRWMAPEVLLPDTVVASSRGPSKASDIYAFGMVALEVRIQSVNIHVVDPICFF
jgi:serine/threonine protein kinase